MKKKMTWVFGNKQKGISVYKLNYKTPSWRVAIWNAGRLHATYEYNSRTEAMEYAKSRKRIGWIDK